MHLDERKKYALTVLSVLIRFFVIVGVLVLLSFIAALLGNLVFGGGISFPVSIVSDVLRGLIVGGFAAGWFFAGIMAGILLVSDYFVRKKKNSLWVYVLLTILAIPIGIVAGVPFAIYTAVKYRLPIKIEFERRRRSRKRRR